MRGRTITGTAIDDTPASAACALFFFFSFPFLKQKSIRYVGCTSSHRRVAQQQILDQFGLFGAAPIREPKTIREAYSGPGRSVRNGRAERMIRTLQERARSLFAHSALDRRIARRKVCGRSDGGLPACSHSKNFRSVSIAGAMSQILIIPFCVRVYLTLNTQQRSLHT